MSDGLEELHEISAESEFAVVSDSPTPLDAHCVDPISTIEAEPETQSPVSLDADVIAPPTPPVVGSKRAPKTKRQREPKDTAEADSRAAFRHAQKLLRKTASTVDIKAALQRSFTQKHESSQGEAPSDAPVVSPIVAPPPSVNDMTDRFLSKVQVKKQQTIQALVHKDSSGRSSLSSSTSHAHHSNPLEAVELVVGDDASNGSKLSFTNSMYTSSRMNPVLNPLLLPMGMEDSRSSSQVSPPAPRATELPFGNNDSNSQSMNDDALFETLRRKHQLMRFKKEQEQLTRQTSSQDQASTSQKEGTLKKIASSSAPSSTFSAASNSVIAAGKGSITAAPSSTAAAAPSSVAPVTPTSLLKQRSLINTFHVSTTDVSFLKRTNSFEHSQSQTIVFNKREA